jgi:hypothetical protein
LSKYLPQIADSSILQPIFKFEDDTALNNKKNTQKPDSNKKSIQTSTTNESILQKDSTLNKTTQTKTLSRITSQTPLKTISVKDSLSVCDSLKSDTVNIKEKTSQTTTSIETKQKTIRFKGEEITVNNNLFFITELILVLGIVFVRVYQQRLFNKFLKSAFSLSTLDNLEKESKTYSTPVFWISFINYTIQASIFLQFILSKSTVPDWREVFQFSSIMFAYNVFKYIAYRISGLIFEKHQLFANYALYHFIILFISGLVFMSVNILYVYAFSLQNILYLGGSFFAIMLVIKYLAFSAMSVKQNVYWFHIFLYLCTLEILPFIVAYNWFNL